MHFWMDILRSKLTLVIISLLFSTLACNFSFSTARIENARLSSDERGERSNKVFGQDDTIFLVGNLKNAPDDTKLKTSWMVIDAAGASSGSIINETEIIAGSGLFEFSLQNNNSLWSPGNYQVDLYMDNVLNQSFEYSVEQTAQPEIQEILMSAQEQGELATTVFKQNDKIYLLGNLMNAFSQTRVKTVWSVVSVKGDNLNGVIEEQEQELVSGPFLFTLDANQPARPAGDYSVDVYLNDLLVTTLLFQVEGGSPNAEMLRMAKDQDGNEPTNVFSPSNSFFLLANIVGSPDEGTDIKVVWSSVQVSEGKAENNLIETYEGTTEDGPFWASLTSNTGEWSIGRYQAELYLANEIVGALSFDVTKNGFNASDAGETSIDGVYLARDADGIDDTNVFAPEDTFYIVGEVIGAGPSVTVETNWIAEFVPGFENNEVISEPDQFQFDEGSFSISLANNEKPWSEGKYSVDLFLEGEKVESHQFLVSSIKVVDPHMAVDEEDSERVTSYSTVQPFYLIFDLENAPSDTKISATWYQLDRTLEDGIKLDDTEFTFGTGSYYIQLNSKSGTWTVGDYGVDLYLEEYFYTSIYFEVSAN